MAIFGPTQNWLKNVTNDISIQEFHNVTSHYVKDTGFPCISLLTFAVYGQAGP